MSDDKPAVRRLNINLPEEAYQDLVRASNRRCVTMTETIRLGLGLAHLALTEEHKGNSLAIVNEFDTVIKIICIPK